MVEDSLQNFILSLVLSLVFTFSNPTAFIFLFTIVVYVTWSFSTLSLNSPSMTNALVYLSQVPNPLMIPLRGVDGTSVASYFLSTNISSNIFKS